MVEHREFNRFRKSAMPKNVCQLCPDEPVELTESNNSREHIIPNAIGGRKKIGGFVCQECNKQTGDTWDAELSKQLNFLCLFLGIERDRGVTPSMIVDTSVGPLKLHHDGTQSLARPIYEVQQFDKSGKLKIQASTLKEAKNLIKRAKSEFPQLDVDAALDSLKIQDTISLKIVHATLNFGGEKSGRSLVKSCLALAWDAGIDAGQCPLAIEYLKNGGEANFGYFYEKDLILHRPADSIFHCVSVSGDPTSKMLLGYVEYFSAHRVVVCLSNQYSGRKFSKTYAIDPRSGVELDLGVDLRFSVEDMRAIYNYDRIPDGAMQAAMEEVMRIGYAAQKERQTKKILEDAAAYGIANCGAKYGEIMTEEHCKKLSQLVAEKLAPLLLHGNGAIHQKTLEFPEK